MNTETRFALYQAGYVHENGSITDDKMICYHADKGALLRGATAKGSIVQKRKQKHDFFVVQQEFDGIEWVGIEGSENYIT